MVSGAPDRSTARHRAHPAHSAGPNGREHVEPECPMGVLPSPSVLPVTLPRAAPSTPSAEGRILTRSRRSGGCVQGAVDPAWRRRTHSSGHNWRRLSLATFRAVLGNDEVLRRTETQVRFRACVDRLGQQLDRGWPYPSSGCDVSFCPQPPCFRSETGSLAFSTLISRRFRIVVAMMKARPDRSRRPPAVEYSRIARRLLARGALVLNCLHATG